MGIDPRSPLSTARRSVIAALFCLRDCWVCRGHNRAEETRRTNIVMITREKPLEKGSDGDLLRGMMGLVVKLLMDTKV